MAKKYSQKDAWSNCAPGDLQRVAASLRGRRRREFLRQAGSVAAGVVVLGAGGYLATRAGTSSPKLPYGGIACAEVVRLMPRYRAQHLRSEVADKIQIHLAQCPECGKMDRSLGKTCATGGAFAFAGAVDRVFFRALPRRWLGIAALHTHGR